MVLSNKKLKQKLRAAKAEVIVESETQNKDAEIYRALDSKFSDSIKMILNTESHKTTLSKREKRRQKVQENPDVLNCVELVGDTYREKDGELKSGKMEVMKKKRKRDENKVKRDVENNRPEKSKKKNKSKNKRRRPESGNNPVKEDGLEKYMIEVSKEQLKPEVDECSKGQDVELSAKIYVGGIPYYSTEDDIRSYFEGCGTIMNVDCMLFPDTGKFRGIAIITFKTEAAVKRALALHGSDMGGLFLTIQPFKSSKYSKTSNFSPSVLEGYNRIYVGNLSWDITENDLRELFSDCSVTSIRLGEDKDTKEFKGYAHVDFADSLSLHMALKLDQKVVRGRPVRISCAVRRNGTVNNSTSMTEESKTDGGEVKIAIEGDNAISESKTEINEVTALSPKIRRRTCYECGERGHLSSACPKKQSLAKESNTDSHEVGVAKTNGHEVTLPTEGNNNISEDRADNNEASAMSSKIRRRTCYECGERGHLSSACPKKQALAKETNADSHEVGVVKTDNHEVGLVTEVNNNISEGKAEDSEASAVSSKIRRRTCYECGERGHLSSSCPKKPATDSRNPVAV
ncbi:protein gar2-like [Dorcoceras hygrometricum]|uniref:Protein gar2-like n=1 Tax=Dorcoceras hygrometricum TaxID=472368 RepID=A0A2Z7AII8_9LAMI|nr:protein gar2-like [Dorcoceras hygrometricum]